MLDLTVNTGAKRQTLIEAIQTRSISWLEESWPVAWSDKFQRSNPLALEIGFGNGGFLASEASGRPDVDFVGIEVSWGLTVHLLRQLDREGTDNCRLIRGDAQAILERCFMPHSLSEMTINFPDPWRKARHHSRRLIQPEFVRLVSQRLQPGGRLIAATDHADYADWIDHVLSAQDNLKSCFETARVHELPGRMQTKYEQKARSQGLPINYFVWENTNPEPSDNRSPSEPATMPNVTFRGDIVIDDVMKRFEPMELKSEAEGEPILVSLGKSWRERDEPTWMVEAHVRDGRLAQRLALIVVGREPGSLIVRAAALGTPRATPGFKAAVNLLGGWIAKQAPDLEVANTTVGPLG